MKKKLFMLAIAAAVFCGFSASAQQTKAKADNTADNVRSDKMYRPQKFTDYAFEGILLDIKQQARVDSLNAAYMAKGKCAQADCKADKKACADKQACDKKLCADNKQACDKKQVCDNKPCADKKACDKQRPGGNRMQARRDYVAKVKEILTPDQYVLFLENIVNMPNPQYMERSHQMHSKEAKHHRGGDFDKAKGNRAKMERTR